MTPLQLKTPSHRYQDFQPINRWSVPETRASWWGQNQKTLPNDLVDETTGRVYWYRSAKQTRLTCLFTLCVVPLEVGARIIKDVLNLLFKSAVLGHYRPCWSSHSVMGCVKRGTVDAVKQYAQVFCFPMIGAAMMLSVLYGLVRPYDGRKLFSSFDRFWHGEAHFSKCFYPHGWYESQASFCDASWVLSMCGFLGGLSALLHEGSHWLAMKVLFEDVNPSIHIESYLNGGGHCAFGGPATVLTPLVRGWDRNTALACTSAAGPLGEMISSLALSMLAFRLRKSSKIAARMICVFATSLSLAHTCKLLSYSVSKLQPVDPGQFASHDFQSVANLLEVERVYLVAFTIACSLVPLYLNLKAMRLISRNEELVRY